MYKINPLTDPRWPVLLAQHADASVFHSREWLDAICRTYGYEPIAFTTSTGEDLSNVLVFCRIDSWLTGKRLVSLPFSDHCQPLAVGRHLEEILRVLAGQRRAKHERYIEIRPAAECGLDETNTGFMKSHSYSTQTVDLSLDLKAIYGRFHESCICRKIKRAEREKLAYESGRSEDLLRKFRHLLLLTRRRHKLPPQPAAWFQNIVRCLGNMITIHVVSKDDIPVASIVTLMHKNSLVYKYGCSDGRFSNMGGTPFLFWKAIQQAKDLGIDEFDLGRSDYEDAGLIAFKEHLGAVSSELRYYRDPGTPMKMKSSKSTSASAWAREALVRLPDSLLSGVGEAVYRHLG